MSDNLNQGKRGEDLAADFLIHRGFEIVRRNYRFRRSEIDIIARRQDWVIFVEVKTRSYHYYGYPEEFVDSQQAGRIFEAAEEFVYSTDWHGHVRFDIISVLVGEQSEIVHFEDAIN